MKLMPFIKGIGLSALNTAKEQSPAILLGLGIASGIAAMVALHKAVPQEEQALCEREIELEDIEDDFKKKKSVTEEEIAEHRKARRDINVKAMKRLVKIYIPVAICGTLSLVCLFCSHRASMRRTAALQVAYDITKGKLEEQTEKMKEVVGLKKTTTVHDKVMEDKVNADPPNSNNIIITGGGSVICYDEYTGRYFYSDPESIRKTINDLNEDIRTEMYISLNQFYHAIGLSNVRMGDDLGWNIEHGNIDVSFTSMLTTEAKPGVPANTPILCLSYDVQPRFNYFGE